MSGAPVPRLSARGRKRGRGARGGYVSRQSSRSLSPRNNTSSASRKSADSNRTQSNASDARPLQSLDDNSAAPQSQSDHGLVPIVQLQTVEEQRDDALNLCNDLKQEVSTLKYDLTQERLTSKVLRQKIEMLETELADETLKVRNLESLNKQLSETNHPGFTGKKQVQGSTFIKKLMKSLDRKYMSLAIAIERTLLDWAQAETMEVLQSEDIPKTRNWMGRMTMVSKHGILSRPRDGEESFRFVPTLITSILGSQEVFFIRSFQSYNVVLESVATSLLQQDVWKHYTVPQKARQDTLDAISSNTVLIGKVKQSLSDSISNRKRSVRDELFQVLRYFTLKTSHDRRRHTPIFNRAEEI